ncbi:unnamed protein product [Rhizophagus irregularis]|nr:unnamed protein product [Rhizophagus irregularis]
MASLDNYMIQTPVDEWSLLGFLKYRKEQKDFSGLKDKEHYRYQMGLAAVLLYDKFTTVERTKAQQRLINFKTEVKEECISRFWHNYIQDKQESELTTLQKEKDLLVERVTLQPGCFTLPNKKPGSNRRFRRSFSNHHSSSKPSLPPPSHKTEDNSFDYYNEETEDASAETSLDEIDAFFQNHPYVAKDVKTKSRKRRSKKDTGSKISTKESKRNNKNSSMNVQSGTEDEIVDAGQTLSGESESSVEETKKSEKSKTILSWEHVIDKIKISSNSDHDWLANGYNISRFFREFQINTIERLKKNPTLSYATDVDEILCLSFIIFTLTPVTLPINVQLIIMEYNTLLTNRKVLREKWRQNWAKCDASMTEKEAKIFECAQLVTRNFFLNISASSTGDNIMNEDTFVHRYCHLMLEEIFNVTNYKLFWANEESSTSKERRKSDGSLHEQFWYSQCSETFGFIIKGCQVELFGMDLAFDGLYRFKKIGRALLPTEDANFLNIEKADRSIEELNRPTTPTGQSYHRESNSSPHKVQIPVLKIPPPALSD